MKTSLRPLQCLVLAAVSLMLAESERCACGAEPERIAWRYETPEGAGGFVRLPNTRWRETTSAGLAYHFREIESTPRHVELRDGSRGIRLRLFAERCEFKFDSDKDWKPLYAGTWTTLDRIPAPPPASTDYRIHVAYFVPSDRQPIRDYALKIRVVMRIVADIYRTDLEAKGYLPREIALEEDAGRPVVHLVRPNRPASFYNGAPQYDNQAQFNRILAEIPPLVADVRRNVLIVFAETYDDTPAKVEWQGTLALGARNSTTGGAGVFSSWILKDEFCACDLPAQKKLLFDETPIRGRVATGWGRPDSPRFQFMQDGIGAVAHELGHALGLPHDTRDVDRDIMGQGFRQLRRNYVAETPADRRVGFSVENARILASSRYLGTDLDVTDDEFPTAEIILPTKLSAGETSLTITLRATDDAELRAALIFDPQSDSVAWGERLTGTSAMLQPSIKVKPLASGDFRLEAYVTDGGGNLTRTSVKGHVSQPQ